MNPELINTAILAGAFLALFGLAELLYHRFKVRVELTRKLVHFGTGILTLLFPVFLDHHWYVLFLCGSFLVILLLSLQFNLLKSINAIKRKSLGSILYPIVVYAMFLIAEKHQSILFFYLPILILAISDPIAALTGKTWPKGKYTILNETKTLMGSGSFFVSAFAISCGTLLSMSAITIVPAVLLGLGVALTTTLAEAASQRGFDNLLIPLTGVGTLIAAEILFQLPLA